jgi:hypothetical protein
MKFHSIKNCVALIRAQTARRYKAIASALSIAIALLSFSAHVYAFDQPIATGVSVKLVETSYVPDSVFLQIDAAVANCPARAWLTWEGGNSFPRGADESKRTSSVKAVQATLLTALAAGKKVNIYARNSSNASAPCVVEHIHVLD